jgi:hypothetical protein
VYEVTVGSIRDKFKQNTQANPSFKDATLKTEGMGV